MGTGGGCRTVEREISRFPSKELLHMPGSSTTPGRSDLAMVRPKRVAFRARNSVGTRGFGFRGSMAGLCPPLPTLRRRPYGRQRTARGRCGSLLLHRSGLAPPTPCRSPGALRVLPPQPRSRVSVGRKSAPATNEDHGRGTVRAQCATAAQYLGIVPIDHLSATADHPAPT